MFKLNSGYQMKFILILAVLCTAFLMLSGTAMAATYEIDDETDFATFLLDSSKWGEDSTYNLNTDIDIGNVAAFSPIGSDAQPFKGTLEGNSHTISNFTYGSSTSGTRSDSAIGIFGYTEDAVIQNVKFDDIVITVHSNAGTVVGMAKNTTFSNIQVTNSDINGNQDGWLDGGINFGGIVGLTMTASEISDCSFSGNVSGSNSTGGIAGDFIGVCTNSSSTGLITGDARVGGLLGNAIGTITDSFSEADVSSDSGNVVIAGLGGLIGTFYGGSISNCNSSGDVDIIFPASVVNESCGGFIGIASYASSELRSSISNCNSTGNVSGDTYVGGFAGAIIGNVSNCQAFGNVTGNRYSGGFVGRLSNDSFISNCSATGSVQTNTISSSNFYRGFGGFVGFMNNSAEISNCYSEGFIDVSLFDVGGFVGIMGMTSVISECYTIGAFVNGNSNVGGFVGLMNNSSKIEKSFAGPSDVSGNSNVGGFVGIMNNATKIENAYAEPLSISATGSNVGGFVGNMAGTASIINTYVPYETFAGSGAITTGIVDSFYANATLTNPADVGRLNSVTLADLKKIETFQTEGGYVSTSWVITSDSSSSIWYIDENNDYPRFVPVPSDSGSSSGSGQATIVDSTTPRPAAPGGPMSPAPSDESASDPDSSENSSGSSNGSENSAKKGSGYFLWILFILGALIILGWFFFIVLRKKDNEDEEKNR